MLNWLASYPKSGNTWVRAFLTAYKNGGYLDINNIHFSARTDINPMCHDIVSPMGKTTELPMSTIASLRPAALLVLAGLLSQGKDDEFWVKSHNARLPIDDIGMVPEHMINKAIYLVRDPRDIALSVANHFGISIEESIDMLSLDASMVKKEEGMFWVLSSWSKHVESWMRRPRLPIAEGGPSIYLYRYEDMVADPGKVFKHIILEVLGWEWDQDVFDDALEATEIGVLREQEDKAGFIESKENATFFHKGQVGRWKTELSDNHVKKIEERNQEVMKGMGYVPKFF